MPKLHALALAALRTRLLTDLDSVLRRLKPQASGSECGGAGGKGKGKLKGDGDDGSPRSCILDGSPKSTRPGMNELGPYDMCTMPDAHDERVTPPGTPQQPANTLVRRRAVLFTEVMLSYVPRRIADVACGSARTVRVQLCMHVALCVLVDLTPYVEFTFCQVATKSRLRIGDIPVSVCHLLNRCNTSSCTDKHHLLRGASRSSRSALRS